MCLEISAFLLNLYNWNDFEALDEILLGIGIPVTFLWLGIGIGMVRDMFIFYIDHQMNRRKYDFFYRYLDSS